MVSGSPAVASTGQGGETRRPRGPGLQPESPRQARDQPAPVQCDVDGQDREQRDADPEVHGAPLMAQQAPEHVGAVGPGRKGEREDVPGTDHGHQQRGRHRVDREVEKDPAQAVEWQRNCHRSVA